MKSSTKCFIVTTLRSLKVTSTDHQKYVEIWKSNIKMFWNSQYNVTQELSTSHQAHSRRKTLNKLWKYCNMEGGNFSRTKSVSLSFSAESEVFVSELWMDKKNIENITNDLLVADTSCHWLQGSAYFTLALTKTVQDVTRNCTFTLKSFKNTKNKPI